MSGLTISDPSTLPNRAKLLETAVGIGQFICKLACWEGDMCNWIGRRMPSRLGSEEPSAVEALDPCIYTGSAGIAIFLADLYACTGDAEFKTTALGGLRRSLAYATRYEDQLPRIAFFSGLLGLEYAATRVALATDDTTLLARSSRIEELINLGLKDEHAFDLIAGNAGAILALLLLRRQLEDEALLDLALLCSDDLVRGAIWLGSKCYWSDPYTARHNFFAPLGGLSHGTAGVALALLELFKETGKSELLTTAQGALAYDDSLFNANLGNWVDARFPFVHHMDGRIEGRFAMAWCHGAGGIALARLHASRIDSSGSTFHNEAASIAIATVKRALEEQTRFAVRNDTTLCHGILGLSEVLLHAASYTDDRDLVLGCRKTVAALSAHYGEVQDWPGGTTGGKLHPSLMLGASGIGHHILRLYGCGVQPILFVGSEEPTTFPQVA